MKTRLLLILMLLVSAASCLGSQIIPPSMLITRYSHIMRSENPPEEIWSINYKQIQVRDELWSKKKIHELFKSIDPTKIEFDKHKTLGKELIMLKPIRAKFIFEVRMHQFSEKSSRTAPPYSFYLVGIEVPSLEEAEQDAAVE